MLPKNTEIHSLTTVEPLMKSRKPAVDCSVTKKHL